MNKIFSIGVDPGKNGGIVSLTNGKITTIQDMPNTFQGILDHFIFLGFPNMINKENTYVYIEHVHAMPLDGSRAAFTFGRHNGHLDAVTTILNIVPNYINPQSWMAYFNLQKGGEAKYSFKKRILDVARRTAAKQRVTRKNPNNELTLKTCDAYLIALYGYNQIIKNKEGQNAT